MLKRINSGNQRKNGIVISYATLIIGNVISLIYTPWMLRILGQREYGTYGLVASFVAYLGLMDFGLGGTYMRFYSQYNAKEKPEKIAALTGMFFSIFSALSICVLAIGFSLCRNPAAVFGSKLTVDELETAQHLMVLLVINIALALVFNIFKTIVTAHERFIFQKLVNLIQTILNPLLTILLLLSGLKSLALVIASLSFTVVSGLINLYYCFRELHVRISFRHWEFPLIKTIFTFSMWLFLSEIIDQINWNVDKYLLGRFSGTIAVAIYGIAATLESYFRQFSSYIYTVYVPEVNRLVALEADNTTLTDLIIKVGRMQYFVLSLVLTGFLFLGRQFCNLWAGSEYDGSFAICLILMIPSMVPLIQNTAMTVIVAKNRHRFRSLVYLGIAVANLLISIPLCIRFGGIGCAIGTALSLLIGNGVIINWYYHRLGLQIMRFWKSILSMSKALVLPGLCGIAIYMAHLPYRWLTLFLSIVVYSLVFVFSMYCFGFNPDEKRLIENLFVKQHLKQRK